MISVIAGNTGYNWKIHAKKELNMYQRKRACPPENCGGFGGYEKLVAIIKDPHHKEYEMILEWQGGEFDPEYFDVEEVSFDDPG
jgi:hypothetical protein